MKRAIHELALHYFEEIVNSKAHGIEELSGFADSFVADIERMISARKDFREEND